MLKNSVAKKLCSKMFIGVILKGLDNKVSYKGKILLLTYWDILSVTLWVKTSTLSFTTRLTAKKS